LLQKRFFGNKAKDKAISGDGFAIRGCDKKIDLQEIRSNGPALEGGLSWRDGKSKWGRPSLNIAEA
jgi:hypothetical protein